MHYLLLYQYTAHWSGLLIYKYEHLWQEVSVKSLILKGPLRPVGLLLLKTIMLKVAMMSHVAHGSLIYKNGYWSESLFWYTGSPQKPVDVYVYLLNATAVNITWTANSNDSFTPVTGYMVNITCDDHWFTLNTSENVLILSMLETGKEYKFTVKAYNQYCIGLESEPVYFIVHHKYFKCGLNSICVFTKN